MGNSSVFIYLLIVVLIVPFEIECVPIASSSTNSNSSRSLTESSSTLTASFPQSLSQNSEKGEKIDNENEIEMQLLQNQKNEIGPFELKKRINIVKYFPEPESEGKTNKKILIKREADDAESDGEFKALDSKRTARVLQQLINAIGPRLSGSFEKTEVTYPSSSYYYYPKNHNDRNGFGVVGKKLTLSNGANIGSNGFGYYPYNSYYRIGNNNARSSFGQEEPQNLIVRRNQKDRIKNYRRCYFNAVSCF